MDKEQKDKIDSMTQFEMCSIWRFSKGGNPLLQGVSGIYFQNRLFNELGGFTPEISKQLGWK